MQQAREIADIEERHGKTDQEQTRTDRASGHCGYFFSTVMLFSRTGSVP